MRSPIAPFPLVLEPVGDDAGDDSHARGEDKTLGCVCLALAKERIDQLGLGLMSRENGTRHETAFTVSIEAKEGVTTGISAADREIGRASCRERVSVVV